ncbi:MAG: class I SAM-dependent methyltransferase, partial [Desulfobacterales bacterium]|nr:class I SAM-dependent methyltransferase [Desulfobacterales bacterium]
LRRFWNPFGAEYGWRPEWNLFERIYIRTFGVVDLPSRLRARLVMHSIRGLPAKTFLDFGSGTGCYSFYLAREPAARVYCMDIDASRINDCQKIASQTGQKNITFFTGSGHKRLQDFHSECLDMALAIEVLQCVPDLNLFLLELYRLLTPGGYFVGHVPVLRYLRKFERILFDDRVITELLTQAGFEIKSITPTFGNFIRQLCEVFNWLTRSRLMVSLFFPFLMLASNFCRVASPDGNYRMFIAQKPIKTAARS